MDGILKKDIEKKNEETKGLQICNYFEIRGCNL